MIWCYGKSLPECDQLLAVNLFWSLKSTVQVLLYSTLLYSTLLYSTLSVNTWHYTKLLHDFDMKKTMH